MGLDMYLTAEKRLSTKSCKERKLITYLELDPENKHEHGRYLSNYSEESKPTRDFINNVPMYGKVGDINYIYFEDGNWRVQAEAGYWRKANHIHRWFVRHVQNGIDDCGTYALTVEHLTQLYNDVCDVLSNKANPEDRLPTVSGFFFGNNGYDDYYFRQLKYTKKLIKKLMRPSVLKNWQLSYNSSW
jgi:hypothetical protein